MDYSVVVPVFNEEKVIDLLYRRLKGVFDPLAKEYEIVFIDDGSKDGSLKMLQDIALRDPRICVIGFDNNYGQHSAVTAGIMEAEGDFIITLDADLQNPPEEIPKLLSEIGKGYDMVSGYRKMRKDNPMRRISSFAVNKIIGIKTGMYLKDYGSMLRVFNKHAAKKLADRHEKTRAYITMLIPEVTRNVKEIEVMHDERHCGKSKYSFLTLLKFVFTIISYDNKSYLKTKINDKPLFVIAKKIKECKEYAINN